MKRAGAFTVAAAASLALTTGTTGPATAAPDITRVGGDQRIPLVTGDRVVVDATGRMVGFESAEGRAHIPVEIRRTGDHTLVVPADAQRLIATGRLDQRLFDLDALTDPRLRESHRDGLKLIVRYEGSATAAARTGVRTAGETRLRRTFPTLGADAVRASRDDLAEVWEALTDRRKDGVRATDIGRVGNGWVLRGFTGFRTAHAGPAVTDGSLLQTWDAHFLEDAASQYAVAFGGKVSRVATGYTRHVKGNELATLKVGLGASAPGKSALASPYAHLPGAPEGNGFSAPQWTPGTRTFHVSTGDGITWLTRFNQTGEPDEWGHPALEGAYETVRPKRYEAGGTYRETFNTGVFGPLLGEGMGVFRTAPDPDTGEQRLVGALPLLADGEGHAGSTRYTSATSALYRDGVEVGRNDDPLSGSQPFTVGAADAEYRLTASVERPADVAAASTRVDAGFTFRSKQVAATTALPVSTVRFAPPVDLASRLPAGVPVLVPVTVQGAAAGGNLKALAVSVSHDDGKSWKSVEVRGGRISVKSPPKGGGIALSAEVTDKQGNTSTLTIHNAWYGK
ncbi:hypothetical protein EF906_15530 [Streptomyces sp. WAC08241]|nr:hypothetical protein EF906_15530 [Streptomyces sp. WAC08241]